MSLTRHRSFTVDLGPVDAENVDMSPMEANSALFRISQAHDAHLNPSGAKEVHLNPDRMRTDKLKGLIIGWTPVSINSLQKN